MKAMQVLEALSFGRLLPHVVTVSKGRFFLEDIEKNPNLYRLEFGEINPDKKYFLIDIHVAAVIESALSGFDCALVYWLGDEYYCYPLDDERGCHES